MFPVLFEVLNYKKVFLGKNWFFHFLNIFFFKMVTIHKGEINDINLLHNILFAF